MAGLATGARLKSTVCNTEIMVIAAPQEEVELTCGGAVMSADGAGNGGAVDAGFADGTTLGKRYTDAEGKLEVLCVKAGEGSLAMGGEPLKLKDAKKLPKTD